MRAVRKSKQSTTLGCIQGVSDESLSSAGKSKTWLNKFCRGEAANWRKKLDFFKCNNMKICIRNRV